MEGYGYAITGTEGSGYADRRPIHIDVDWSGRRLSIDLNPISI